MRVASRLIAFLFGVALVGAQPVAAATSPQLAPLEQQIATLARTLPTEMGIAALDMGTNESICINCEAAFPMASTVKIAIAANYLAQVEYGRRTFDRRIGGRTASQLMSAMIIRSDNYATDLLLRDLGGPQTVQKWLTQNGITGLRIDRSIAQLLRARRDLWDVRDSSTPRAMVDLLRRLDSGQLLQPTSRSYLFGLMARCATGSNRMKALLPAGTPVEHKTGTLSGYTSDVGFITMPDGRRIAVALFVRSTANRPRTIAQAARAIYDGFAALWRTPFSAAALGTP